MLVYIKFMFNTIQSLLNSA